MPPAEPPTPAVRRTKTCTFERGRVIVARFLPGAELTLDGARENLAATAELADGRRWPVLVDLRNVRSQSSEARAHLAGPDATKVSLRVALLVSSPLSRAIGNFYLGFNRPEVPTRLFTDEVEAERWLLDERAAR